MRVLVTGGAGFIGCNLSRALDVAGHDVVVVDNLSRGGSDSNLRWLLGTAGHRATFRQADVTDVAAMASVLSLDGPMDAVVHLAGQTTVTDSVSDPMADFEANARGTLVVLDAVRRYAPSAHLVFASSNKVYGDLRWLRTEQTSTRYILPDHPDGISESFPTNAVSPYGCSKLAADCYVRDAVTTYGLATTVVRMSCVYGRWQNGVAGQGWVSWFVRSALLGEPLTIFGDGLQVRDLLHVDDLMDVYLAILEAGPPNQERSDAVYNLGGGPAHSLAVWAEFGPLLEELIRRPIDVRYGQRRVGDQDVFIADTSKLSTALGWKPRRTPRDGVADLVDWTASRLADNTLSGGGNR
ncbi:MAG: SDR family NAD(P)-dependent oxidoreductase [Pseudonocardia sp.]|nr:SDR family NAD(P)-dependent oxidoreductase [Pseudonocardia sp.]